MHRCEALPSITSADDGGRAAFPEAARTGNPAALVAAGTEFLSNRGVLPITADMVMRWADAETGRVSHLSRQIRLNLWVYAALTVMGLIRVHFAWPENRQWAMVPLGLA